MKSRMLVVLLALAVLVGCAGNGVAQDAEKKEVAQPRKVPLELMQKAQTQGTVRVVVDLNASYRPEHELAPDAVIAQRQAIANAQNELVTELGATTHKVTRRFTRGGIALIVGADALAILEQSKLVKKVTEDVAMSPN
jgi:outer membrane biogenesis lipoprotein LolB